MRIASILAALLLLLGCSGEPVPTANVNPCNDLRLMLRPEFVEEMQRQRKLTLPEVGEPCPLGYPLRLMAGDEMLARFVGEASTVASGEPEQPPVTTTTEPQVTIDECIAFEFVPKFEGGDEAARALWVYDTLKKMGAVQVDPQKMEGCRKKFAFKITIDDEVIFSIELARGPWVNAPDVTITPSALPETTTTVEVTTTSTEPSVETTTTIPEVLDDRFNGEMVY